MGWLLSEAIAVTLLPLMGVLALSTRARRRAVRTGRALVRRMPGRPAPPPKPLGRPIEAVARDARRLGRRYRQTRYGVSYAKSEAVRRAYDHVLGEGCDALGLSHLLDVLPPGDELDTERTRVERLLYRWGLALDDVA